MTAATGRREFLINVLKISGQITLANSAIYSVSLVSSKGKFGGLTAGAKCYDICGLPVAVGTVLPACSIYEGGPQNTMATYTCKSWGSWQMNVGGGSYIGFCGPGPC